MPTQRGAILLLYHLTRGLTTLIENLVHTVVAVTPAPTVTWKILKPVDIAPTEATHPTMTAYLGCTNEELVVVAVRQVLKDMPSHLSLYPICYGQPVYTGTNL